MVLRNVRLGCGRVRRRVGLKSLLLALALAVWVAVVTVKEGGIAGVRPHQVIHIYACNTECLNPSDTSAQSIKARVGPCRCASRERHSP